MRTTKRWWVPAALVLVLVGVGCSSSDDEGASAAVSQGAATEDSGNGAVAASPAAPAPSGTPLQATRSLIQTADMSLRVDDVDAAADRAVALAEERAGYLSGQQLARTEEGATGSVELHVPSARFRDLLDALAELGDVLTRDVDTQDVTDQVVDLESRLFTAQASVERVRGLLAEAATVDEVVRLEGEVTARETIVEQLSGQLGVLSEQVALSVVTVRLGETVPPPLETDPRPSEDIPGFGSGLENGWVTFQNVLGVALTFVGFVLPFAIVAGPVLLVLWWWRRRPDGQPEPTPAPE